MSSNSTGAQFEILVDGKTRSWRDGRETAPFLLMIANEEESRADLLSHCLAYWIFRLK
jgi:hypothetical protein